VHRRQRRATRDVVAPACAHPVRYRRKRCAGYHHPFPCNGCSTAKRLRGAPRGTRQPPCPRRRRSINRASTRSASYLRSWKRRLSFRNIRSCTFRQRSVGGG
jgi:hypothetical protein